MQQLPIELSEKLYVQLASLNKAIGMDDQKEPNGVTKGRVHMGVIRGVIFVKIGKSCNFLHLTATFRLNVICQNVTKIARTFFKTYLIQ